MASGKTIFVNADGDIHIGMAGPAGFGDGTAADIEKALAALKGRKLWREKGECWCSLFVKK